MDYSQVLALAGLVTAVAVVILVIVTGLAVVMLARIATALEKAANKK